jgi:predicted AlkP superfamily phosphohydrolase/phosphomutase
MKPSILVIGLDAATLDLIEPWANAGYLPAINAIMTDGATGRCLSTPNMHSASAWTSILTGLNPGRHGLFVFSDRDRATGSQVFFKGGDREGATIVSHLNHRGLTAGLLNVPMTYPAEGSPGCFSISGLDAPSLDAEAFFPPSLRDELFSRFPDYAFTPKRLGKLMSAGDIARALAAWLALIETQTRAAEYLLETHPVDFFMTVYTASDWGGHNLWQCSDPTEPADPEKETRQTGLLELYRALDGAIARLVAHTGEGTHVYIISDHGMGPHSGASYHLPGWLEEKGYLTRSRTAASASMIGSAGQIARRWVPQGLKERLKSRISQDRLRRLQSPEKHAFFDSIDWSRTTAYSEPGRHVIDINLQGRNRAGIVPPGRYDELCRQIIDDLGGWSDPDGRRVVEKVTRREDVYHGPHAGRASDLFVHWNPNASVGPPPPEIQARGFWWSGDHRPEGVLICRGPGVRRQVTIDAVTVCDLVPTLMYFAGLPVPDLLDGNVIDQACSAEFRAANPLVVADAGASVSSRPTPLTDSEERMIEEKLRDLGYL